jgi:hypothetical protein
MHGLAIKEAKATSELPKRTLVSACFDRKSANAGHNSNPMDLTGVFGGVLYCSHCSEVMAFSGLTETDEEVDEEKQRMVYCHFYVPKYFSTAPQIFRVPERCPADVAREVQSAFQLFWLDPSSCINRQRAAIELFLTHLRIPGQTAARKPITLHSRIEKLKVKQPDLAESLMALKWLGNSGSHPGVVTREDAFDGFDLLEHVLVERYEQHKKQLTKLRKEINRRCGPKKR